MSDSTNRLRAVLLVGFMLSLMVACGSLTLRGPGYGLVALLALATSGASALGWVVTQTFALRQEQRSGQAAAEPE